MRHEIGFNRGSRVTNRRCGLRESIETIPLEMPGLAGLSVPSAPTSCASIEADQFRLTLFAIHSLFPEAKVISLRSSRTATPRVSDQSHQHLELRCHDLGC
jgi:hypothetical protein